MHRGVTSALLGIGLAAIVASAQAGEALPSGVAQRLDNAPVEFSMTAAKRERLMIIQQNTARQRHYRGGGSGRGGGGYGYGYGRGGYNRGYGNGPRYGGGVRLQPPASSFGCGGVPCRRW